MGLFKANTETHWLLDSSPPSQATAAETMDVDPEASDAAVGAAYISDSRRSISISHGRKARLRKLSLKMALTIGGGAALCAILAVAVPLRQRRYQIVGRRPEVQDLQATGVYTVQLENPAVQHWGVECKAACRDAGYCQEFCGMGNACCKFGDPLAPPECGGIQSWGSKDSFTCVTPVRADYMIAKAPVKGSSIRNWGQDCWDACKEGGLCQEFCGMGNACCRWRSASDPPECHGITQWGSKDRHTCVTPVNPYYKADLQSPTQVKNWGMDCLATCADAGYCQEFCGYGNACCKFGDANPRPECLGVQKWGSKDRYTCVAPVNPAFVTADPPPGKGLRNWAEDCWTACNSTAGYCPHFCGHGNACCRFASSHAPPECQGIQDFGAKDRHTCVAPVNPVWQLTVNSTVQNWGQDCWASCKEVGGVCPDFCGLGNACCRFGNPYDPPECYGITKWGAKDHHTCVKPVNVGLLVNHLAQDCWQHCNGAGFCEGWCGEGNACCRHHAATDPDECQGVTYWPKHDTHTCVKAAPAFAGVPKAEAEGECIPGQVLDASGKCRKATGPTLMTFYMYRATSDAWGSRVGHTNLGNGNFGNIEGVLWRLHKDVVTTCPRKDGVNRILRYVVTMMNPDTLFRPPVHSQFGPYVDFHQGQCMFNNSNCKALWSKYGYTVGCRHETSLNAEDPVYEGPPMAVSYSLPGRCPSEPLGAGDQKSASCAIEEPGGECLVPDGKPTCTWKAEYAGEIRIDELSGITDPVGFCRDGNVEYDADTDRGRGATFWDGRRDAVLSRHRATFVRELFKMKYPNYPDTLGEPECDWFR